MFRKSTNSSIFRVFDEYLFAYRCLQAEIFFLDSSDIRSTKNVKNAMRERARKIFPNTDIFKISCFYICYNVIVR